MNTIPLSIVYSILLVILPIISIVINIVCLKHLNKWYLVYDRAVLRAMLFSVFLLLPSMIVAILITNNI